MATHLDNPAGRLHGTFVRFLQVPGGSSLDATWEATFGCQGVQELSEYLSESASLLRDCVAAARSLDPGVEWPDNLFHYPSWAKPIFGFESGNRAGGIDPTHLISPDALAALSSLSTTLHHSVPERVFAAGHDYDELLPVTSQLEELAADVWADEELPEVVRSRICKKILGAVRSIKYAEYRGIEKVAEDVQAAFNEVSPNVGANS